MPGLEGRAFYPLLPTSFAKYFQMLSNIHSARMYAAQPCSPTSCGMERIINSSNGYFSLYESSLNSIRERKYSFRQFIFLPIRRRSGIQD